MNLRFDTPVQFLRGVGPRRAEAFARMGVRTVEELLYTIPHRYLDATTVTPIAQADVGTDVTLIGRVVSKGVLPTRRRLRIFRAVIKDDSGLIECSWPGQAFLDRTIKEGQLLLVSGPVKYYHGRQMTPREQIVLADDADDESARDGLVVPVYPATEGLSHRQVRRVISDHLDDMLETIEDTTPPALWKKLKLPELKTALRTVHKPDTSAEAELGRRRLAFDEMFDLQLVVARARFLAKESSTGYAHELKKELTTQLKDNLPFELTGDQIRSIRDITTDMTAKERMHRLLMGDVGSGKTVVAVFAMLLAIENDTQAVFMVPTEILAEQHARTVGALLEKLNLKPELLLGRFTPGEKKKIRARIASGASRLIIGTHALFQEKTTFHRLGLVVIDEQHRFGVEQRAALVEKGPSPDVLLLSATPIPRTMALTLYGDLDMSVIKEKPPGRTPIKTSLRGNRSRGGVLDFIRKECEAGRQAYVVYPVIDESEKVDLKAASTMAESLQETLEPLKVGLVHGRLKSDERDVTMREFRDGIINVLVATTVIEVGIDVANATVMVIEHPERFGLAQLHQLRGRVGRGADESHCILIADGPSRDRLAEFAVTEDGFRIAELDLKERGMGTLAGARQSGGLSLRFTDLAEDADLVSAARAPALEIIKKDPSLGSAANAPLRARIERRHERGMELFRIG